MPYQRQRFRWLLFLLMLSLLLVVQPVFGEGEDDKVGEAMAAAAATAEEAVEDLDEAVPPTPAQPDPVEEEVKEEAPVDPEPAKEEEPVKEDPPVAKKAPPVEEKKKDPPIVEDVKEKVQEVVEKAKEVKEEVVEKVAKAAPGKASKSPLSGIVDKVVSKTKKFVDRVKNSSSKEKKLAAVGVLGTWGLAVGIGWMVQSTSSPTPAPARKGK